VPLIAVAILSYGAGLLGGFGLGATLTGVCGVAIALAAALHRDAIICAGGVALASGALIAAGTRVGDARCEREVIRGGVHGAIIEEEAAPGAFVHARALEWRRATRLRGVPSSCMVSSRRLSAAMSFTMRRLSSSPDPIGGGAGVLARRRRSIGSFQPMPRSRGRCSSPTRAISLPRSEIVMRQQGSRTCSRSRGCTSESSPWRSRSCSNFFIWRGAQRRSRRSSPSPCMSP